MSATGLSPLSTDKSRAPFVSVVMNCYNGASYLREALGSVLAQTFTDWEIVFWDNQSTDESAAIFKSFSDDRFHYFLALEHTVLGQARNLAVERARGEWVAFLDCDDLWLPEKLERQVAVIHEEGAELGLIYGGARCLVEGCGSETKMARATRGYERREAQWRLLEGDIFRELLKGNFVFLTSTLVRRSAYWSVGGIDPFLRQAEDYDLLVKISRFFKARAVQGEVCRYRIHNSNLTHSQADHDYQEPIAILGRYLPAAEAKVGIRSHQTSFAVDEMRRGYLFKGLRRLLLQGDVTLLCGKVAKLVRGRLRYS